MSKQYRVVLASRVDQMLRRHILFISNVSIRRAELFTDEFESLVTQLKENPFLFPWDEDQNLPQRKYRKASFAKYYKALFQVNGDTVYLEAVCDCREDLKRVFQ